MPNTIFRWQPIEMERVTTAYNVLISDGDSGTEQRRKKGVEKFGYQATFELPFKEFNALRRYVQARSGPFDTFLIPSWEEETHLAQAASQSATALVVDDVQDADNNAIFSNTGRTSRIYVQDGILHKAPEILTISSVVSNTLNITSPLANAYPRGSVVGIAYQVRLLQSAMEGEPESFDLSTKQWYFRSSLTFIEVF